MPIYEYQCLKCQHGFELLQRFSDPQVTVCPRCGGEVQQMISAPAVQFKGTGWYVTDYARKSGTPAANGTTKKVESSSENKSSESKPADTKPSESKPAASPEKK